MATHVEQFVTGEVNLGAIHGYLWVAWGPGIQLRDPQIGVGHSTRWRCRRRWKTWVLEDEDHTKLCSAGRKHRDKYEISGPLGAYLLQILRTAEPVPGGGILYGKVGHLKETSGSPLVTVKMSHEKKPHRGGTQGSFTGTIEAVRPVPTPVLLLAVKLTAGSWARQLPQQGWHAVSSSSGIGGAWGGDGGNGGDGGGNGG